MRTEIKIYQDNIYYNLDLYDDEPLSIVKELKDFQEPESTQSEWSKTIKIPGTHNNNRIFSNIFDVNHSVINTSSTQFNTDFNPNLKANCILFREGIPQLRGYLQLTNIVILDEYSIDYEVVVIGRTANLFQDLGDSKLTDLDLSAYNHLWTYDNIVDSWTAPTGVGYVYPMINRNNDEQLYRTREWYPAVYVKTIVDAIFSEAGYEYSSAFFGSAIFKKLIVPFTSGTYKIPQADVEDRLFEIDYSVDTVYTAVSSTPTKIDFDQTVKNSNPAGIALSAWTVPTGFNGNFIFRSEISCTFKYTGAGTSNIGFFLNLAIKYNDGTTDRTLKLQQVTIQWDGTINTNDTLDFTAVVQSDMFYAYEGYEFWVEHYESALSTLATDLDIKFKAGSAFFNSSDGQYFAGSTVNITAALPDMKQSEFLKSLIKMFNLYVEVDKIQDKKLLIEPRDDFYTSTVVDWTERLDVSQDVTIRPMGALDFRTLEFLYKSDEDIYNKQYQQTALNTYGWRRVEVNNDFLNETKKVEIDFAPSPLTESANNDRLVTKIIYYDNDNKVSKQSAKPRILFYGGLKNTTGYVIGIDPVPPPPARLGNWHTQYPYAGHVDDPDNPQYDLTFGLPEVLFYGVAKPRTITNGNLYNRYWRRSINEITNKDSKILEGYFHLTNVDLQNISFRSLYLIDRQYYRLVKVDADLNSDNLAKCMFMKLATADSYTSQTTTPNNGSGTFDGEVLGDLMYYNHLDFLDLGQSFGTIVDQQTSESVATLKSQVIVTTSNVNLPNAETALVEGKSIEYTVYNSGTSVINAGGLSIQPSTAARIISNGTSWVRLTDTGGGGNGSLPLTIISVDTTVDAKSQIIEATDIITVTFPAADLWVTDSESLVMYLNNNSGGDITADVDGGGTINGEGSQVIAPGDTMGLYSNGTELRFM